MNSLLKKYCTCFVFFFSILTYSQTSVYEKDAKEIQEYLNSPGKEPKPELLRKIKYYKQYYSNQKSQDTLLQVLSFEIRYSSSYDLYEPTYELCKAYFAYDSTFNNPYNFWTVSDYIGILELLYKKKELLEFIESAYSTYDKNNTPSHLLNVFANSYYELKEYQLAIETYTLIYKLAKTNDHFVKAGMQNNIGLSYFLMVNKNKAIEHYNIAKKHWLIEQEADPDYKEYMLGIIDINIAKAKNMDEDNDCEILSLYQNLIEYKHIQKQIDTRFPYFIYLSLIKFSYICGEEELTKQYLKELNESNTIKYLSRAESSVYKIVNTLLSLNLPENSTFAYRKNNYYTLLDFIKSCKTDSTHNTPLKLVSQNLNLTNKLLTSKHSIVLKEQKQNQLEKIIFGLSIIIISILAYFLYRIYRNSKLINNQKQELNKALDEREVLIKEIHHRVKNNLQMISGFAVIEQSRNTDKFDTQSFSNQIKSVATVYNMLSDINTLTDVDFNAYVNKLGEEILKTLHISHINIHTQINKVCFNLDYTIYLGLIINELITNTIKHGQIEESGEIHIQVQSLTHSKFKLIYRDNGIGISDAQTNSQRIGKRLIELLSKKIHATSKSYTDNGFIFELTLNLINNE